MEKFAKFIKDVEPLDEGLVVWKKDEVYAIVNETEKFYAIDQYEFNTLIWMDKKCEGSLFNILECPYERK